MGHAGHRHRLLVVFPFEQPLPNALTQGLLDSIRQGEIHERHEKKRVLDQTFESLGDRDLLLY
jgi:hypothetical protein